MQIATAGTWYRTRSVGDGITLIYEQFIKEYYRCNIWHVRGRSRDLLVDSGMGVVTLRDRVAELADRPILAVATHSHFDHVGAHHEFDERAIHSAEAEVLARPDRRNTVADKYVSDDFIFTAPPPGHWDPLQYCVHPAPPTRILEEGSIIDTGDRSFEVMHLPGHSVGSIALYEKASGILFSGDVVYDGELAYDAGNSGEMREYVASMKRLLDIEVSIVHGGHYPSFGREHLRSIAREFLDRFDR